MKQDRFLLGIVAAIVIIAALSLGIYLTRQTQPEYQPEETPEGVLNNYFLALIQKDYRRAYGYVMEGENKPDYNTFRNAFATNLNLTDTGITIGKVIDAQDNPVSVEVTIHRTYGGPFSEISREEQIALLIRQNGVWKIQSAPYPFWGWDWYQPTADAKTAP